MDYATHYARAVELADLADKAYAMGGEEMLHRAEVLAGMSRARGQLAWVAYMGVDALAAEQLAEDDPAAPVRPLRSTP
ncbi:hypothetical protein [Spirillospora sp. NBC_01491]|uniref:hypothetical protein n=1 Tax=Spirillospora sp. NBC_01491 TaxID=2976007 RepID=UPI002E34E5A2|nr:hypothetical protein [Spirillospora sp. NBC_01491]